MSNEQIEFEPNPEREAMVKEAIELHGEPTTVEHIAQFLPADFDLGEDDIAPFLQAQPAPATLSALSDVEFEGELPKVEAPAPEVASVAEAAPATETEPPPPTAEEIEAAVARRNAADQALANRRAELIVAQGVERTARDRLARAVGQFQSGTAFASLTPEQLRRQHVQEQQAIRKAQQDGTMPMPPRAGIGKSMIDRIAAAQRGGSPGRGDYRRGAYPSQARGRTVKLPSQV